MPIKSRIRTIPHYPHEGIQFRDVTTLLKDPIGLRTTIQEIVTRYQPIKIDKVVAIESRGFIVGAPVAYALGVGFVPIRKPGKLPAETIGCEYQLEYGSDRIEMHVDAIQRGERFYWWMISLLQAAPWRLRPSWFKKWAEKLSNVVLWSIYPMWVEEQNWKSKD